MYAHGLIKFYNSALRAEECLGQLSNLFSQGTKNKLDIVDFFAISSKRFGTGK